MALRSPSWLGSFGQETLDVAADGLDLGNAAQISGNLTFDTGGEPRGLPTVPTAADAATSKAYVDSIAQGFSPKPYCRLASNEDFDAFTAGGSGIGATLTSPTTALAENDVDGVTVVLGDRVLVHDYGAGISDPDNGIYEVTQLADAGANAMVLTRATDFDEDAEVNQGDCAFVAEGTVHAQRTFCLITTDPVVVDTTAQQWTIVSGPGFITAGAGLVDTANTFSVDLDTAADAQGAGTGGGSSGLEFDAAGDSGQLRVKVDPDGGIQRNALGLQVELDPAGAISSGAAGLAVNVDGVTISIIGNQLVVAGASEATRIENTLNAGAAVAAFDPVYFDGNDTVAPADADSAGGTGRLVVGVAANAAAIGNPVSFVTSGREVTGALTALGATAGDPVWLANGGGLTLTAPTGANDRVLVGYAMNADDLFVVLMQLGRGA